LKGGEEVNVSNVNVKAEVNSKQSKQNKKTAEDNQEFGFILAGALVNTPMQGENTEKINLEGLSETAMDDKEIKSLLLSTKGEIADFK